MFWDNFVSLCTNKGVSPNTVAKELGLSSGSITAWKRGTTPRNAAVAKIADYFCVTTNQLLGYEPINEEKPATENGDGQNEQVLELMELMLKLSPEQRAREIAYLRDIVNGRDM